MDVLVGGAGARAVSDRARCSAGRLLGASLGVFAAAAAAGCGDATGALVAALRHATAIEAACESGGMIAVPASPRLREETPAPWGDTEPMACCVDATSRSSLSGAHLRPAARGPVSLRRTIARLASRVACRHVDVGFSRALVTFVKYAVLAASASSLEPIMTPFDDDANNLTAPKSVH